MESAPSAVVASNFALYFGILAFLYMVRSRANSFRDTVLAGALVAFNPAIVYAHGGYAEPLCFALAAAGFGLLERRCWIEAGIAGGLLGAARPTGILFIVAQRAGAARSANSSASAGSAYWSVLSCARRGHLSGCFSCITAAVMPWPGCICMRNGEYTGEVSQR